MNTRSNGMMSSKLQVEGNMVESALKPSLGMFIIEVDEYPYPTEDKVPGGYFMSKVEKVESRIKDNRHMLDVSYKLCSRDCEFYNIKQTYPEGSKPLKDFYKAMVAAGVKRGSGVEATIGVCETIQLAYVSEKSDIGSIIKRVPNSAKFPTEEDLYEDEDLAEEE